MKILFSTFLDNFDNVDFTNNIAVSWKNNQKTYSELVRDVAKLRKLVLDKGIKKGMNVAMIFSNSYDFVKTFFAITTLGAVAVIIPLILPYEMLRTTLKKFEASTVIFEKEVEKVVPMILQLFCLQEKPQDKQKELYYLIVLCYVARITGY